MALQSVNIKLYSKASGMLKGYMKPRFLTTEDLRKLVLRAKINVTGDKNANPVNDEMFYSWMRGLRESSMIAEVKKGLYANLAAVPKPTAQEIAHYLVPDAIVSLHSALGEGGVLNNPSTVVTCVVPVSPDEWRKHKIKKPSVSLDGIGKFHFYTMSKSMVYPEPSREAKITEADYLDESKESYAQATKEKALMDWIYLSSKNRSDMAGQTPPVNMDFGLLSVPRLKRLAAAMGLSTQLQAFLTEKAEYDNNPNTRYNMDTSLGL